MQGTMQSVKETTELRQWFVMRDLKRGNAKQPAYKLLGELKIRFFRHSCISPWQYNHVIQRLWTL